MPRPARRLACTLLVLALAPCGAGCRAGETPAPGPPGVSSEVLGPFLTQPWNPLPLPPQGGPPPGWAEAEASLDPAICGAGHPQQLREWESSLHAAAYSPGFSGQLIEGALATRASIRECQRCHAPLAEQQPGEAGFDAALRRRGLVCAACHVRGQRRFGPPRRPELRSVDGPLPHGGFEARPEFQESRFCAPCHQFFDDPGVNGKPTQDTWGEWRRSAFAEAGRTCQSCHMPDRAHTWRGIHDPEMVRAAVAVDLVPGDLEGDTLTAALVLASREVGHAFPTYVTPRVFLAVWQEDAAGHELDGTRVEALIGREIDFGVDPPREVFDTRVAPGESVKLDYAVARGAEAVALVGRVTVDPDHHYRGVYASLLASLRDPGARLRIEAAQRRATESSYVLSELRRPLRAGPR
jgi:hypothetical protein